MRTHVFVRSEDSFCSLLLKQTKQNKIYFPLVKENKTKNFLVLFFFFETKIST